MTPEQMSELREKWNEVTESSNAILGAAMVPLMQNGMVDAVTRYTNAEFEFGLLVDDLEGEFSE